MKKMTVSTNTVAKFGLFTAISILISSVVGIGIFAKNQEIFGQNNGRQIFIILSWVIGSLIALSMAWTFLEIMQLRPGSNAGFAGWAEKLIGNRFGSVIKVAHPFVHYAFVMTVYFYYGYGFMYEAITGTPSTGMVGPTVTAFVGPIFLIVINLVAQKASGAIIKVISIIKLLPLFIVIFGGIFFFSHDGGYDKPLSYDANVYEDRTPWVGLLFAIPSVLFDYAGFLVVGNVAKDIKNPKKNLPLSVIIGMFGIIIIYLAVTIAQVHQNSSTVAGTIDHITNGTKWLTKVLLIVVTISAFGVANVFSIAGPKAMQNLITDKEIPIFKFEECKNWFSRGLYKLNRKIKNMFKSDYTQGAIIFLVMVLVWTTVQAVWNALDYKIAPNGDKEYLVFDKMSNNPSMTIFTVYAIMCFWTLMNRFTKKVEMEHKTMSWLTATISVLGLLSVVGFQLIYVTFVLGVKDWENEHQQILSYLIYTFIYIALPIALIAWGHRRVKKGLQGHNYPKEEKSNS